MSAAGDITSNKDEDDFCEKNLDNTSAEGTAQRKIPSIENPFGKNADLGDSLIIMSTTDAQTILDSKEKESKPKITDILTQNQETIHENAPKTNLLVTSETSKGSGDINFSTDEGFKSVESKPHSGDGTKENSAKSIDADQNDVKQPKNISSALNDDDIDDIILKWDDDDGSGPKPDYSGDNDAIQKDQDPTDKLDKLLESEPTCAINKADSFKSLKAEATDTQPKEQLTNLEFENELKSAENKDDTSKSLEDVALTDKQLIEDIDNSELDIEPNSTKNIADSPKLLEVEASTDKTKLIPDIATNIDTINQNLQEEKLLESETVTEVKNNDAMEINEEELLREDAKESEMDVDPSNNSIEENLEKDTEVDKRINQNKPLETKSAEEDIKIAKEINTNTDLIIKENNNLLEADIAEAEPELTNTEAQLVQETEKSLEVNYLEASKIDKLQKDGTAECKSTVDENDKTDENKEKTIKIKNTDDANDRENENKDITTETKDKENEKDVNKEGTVDSLHVIKEVHNVSSEINRKTLGFNQPDVMLEIPTQELIDIDDVLDSPDDSKVEDALIYNKFGDENDEKDDGHKIDGPEGMEKDKETSEKPIEVAAAPTLEATPSTSKGNEMIPDTSDELPEVTDSLGLLAESRRVMDDDDEQYDDGDDDDSDLDESSNQMTAEHSEDSNAPPSETEPGREEQEGDTEDNMAEAEDNLEGPEDNLEVAEDTLEDNLEAEDNEIACEEDFEFTVNDVTNHFDDVPMKIEKEGVVGGNVEPLLPGLKTAVTEGVSEIKIKEEKKDSEPRIRKRTEDTVAKSVRKRDRTSVASSNDDVIEQTVEIETVKLSDDEDEEPSVQASTEEKIKETVDQKTEEKIKDVKTEDSLREAEATKVSPKSSPSKLKNLSIMKAASVVNFVDLEESSSEDDTQVQESQLKKLLESKHIPPAFPVEGITINIPTGIDIMSSSTTNRSEFTVKEGEVVISGVPKPPPHKPARLNTSEVTIKTASSSEQTLVIPEAKLNEQYQEPKKPKLGLEIFSLDSDEEDNTADKQEEPKRQKNCINFSCSSGLTEFLVADNATAAFYDASKKKKPLVCRPCADAVLDRQKKLVEGIKNMTPLLDLDIISIPQDLVEILDSESEDEDTPLQQGDVIGEEAAGFLEDNLAELLNKTWKDLKLDDRLKETQNELSTEIEKLEADSKEINQMLIDCQHATDKLRSELYATFECTIQELPSIVIYETPEFNYIGPEADNVGPPSILESRLNAKRKISSGNETPAKRPAIPLGYAPLGDPKSKTSDIKVIDNKADDDKDISVVKLSVESAPPDLPPVGECPRPPLKMGMQVYAMKNAFGPWLKGKIVEIMPKSSNTSQFTVCRVKFDHKQTKTNGKVLPGRCIAYAEPAEVRMTIGTRIIALFKGSNKKESYYSGVVAEIPNPVNSYRYLVFFDDGYAQYVHHSYTRIVVECSPLVWEEVHPLSREFVREYLMAYPERPMVRLHEGQHLKTEWDGKWWSSRVNKVDASLAQVVFAADGRREWVYRGSTRLAPLYLELRAAERHRPRPVPRTKQLRSNMPYVEYTRSDEPATKIQDTPAPISTMTVQQQQQNEEMRRQRAVAKKSTASATSAPPAAGAHALSSRVVYYTPKNAVRPHKLVPHKCSPKCKRSDVLSLKELRTYNPLAKPLLSGWERQIVRFKGQREVMYRAPCGRRLRNMKELHRYLRLTNSDLPVDLFDFYHATHCLAEFVLNKCLVGKKDLSHGKENVPVPCVNYYDESLPEFCSYNTERTPTSGVPLNLDPEFLCGCDCTDDCEDKSKCACWQLTLEGARTIGLDGSNIGYEYKRLPEPLPSGIYECNSRCKCKQTCLNRVAQHPLQLKLQVFKTLNRGWGIRALNDVPKGAFLCVYAGNLLTDATANLDGLNEGDEYLAELDYIEVVEQMKEGYEQDIPEIDKKLDKKESVNEESEEESSSSSEADDTGTTDKEDDDFRPGHIGLGVMEFNKRLRRRGRNKKEEKKKENDKEKESKDNEDDCITISDDEEVREPLRFTAQPGMGGNDFISKYRSVRSYFGEDEACYIMDAKVQGNIGRYLNHSCSPNVFVQNVFVDTHDPRFPWVAFFALSHIKAGTELTWNYNYDVGSVPGKVLYCYCEAPNCRGRLL